MKPVEIRAQAGVRNDLPPDRFAPGDLLVAQNIELDETGKAYRRLGTARQATGAYHSLWGDSEAAYVVKDGVLSLFSAAQGITPITPVAGKRVVYQRVLDSVFWTDGVTTGVLNGATSRNAGVELPQPPAATQTLGSLRPEHILCV